MKESSTFNEHDKPNEIVCGFIPDLYNNKYNYIIEIDGSIHKNKSIKKIDKIKDKVFNNKGIIVFRIEAYNYDHFGILCDKIEFLRKRKDYKPKTILKRKAADIY